MKLTEIHKQLNKLQNQYNNLEDRFKVYEHNYVIIKNLLTEMNIHEYTEQGERE